MEGSERPMESQQGSQSFQRLTAKKVLIADLIDGEYVREEGWQPNYILTPFNEKVSRVNIVCIVISKDENPELTYKSLVVDDSSASVNIRIFDSRPSINSINVGDIVTLIGRPRLYGSEIYIIPEILRKETDVRWLEIRKKEMSARKKPSVPNVNNVEENINTNNNDVNNSNNNNIEMNNQVAQINATNTTAQTNPATSQQPSQGLETQKFDYVEESVESDADNILNLIRQKDEGEGVSIEEVLSSFNKEGGEQTIKTLIETGEVFEVKPGRIKVLE